MISNLQQRLKYNRAKETDNETQLETNISFLQSHSLDHMSDDLLKGKELVLLKEEISVTLNFNCSLSYDYCQCVLLLMQSVQNFTYLL